MDRRHPGPGGFTDFAHAWFFFRASSTRRRSRSGSGGGTPGRTGPTGGGRRAYAELPAGPGRVGSGLPSRADACPRDARDCSGPGSDRLMDPLSISRRSPLLTALRSPFPAALRFSPLSALRPPRGQWGTIGRAPNPRRGRMPLRGKTRRRLERPVFRPSPRDCHGRERSDRSPTPERAPRRPAERPDP